MHLTSGRHRATSKRHSDHLCGVYGERILMTMKIYTRTGDRGDTALLGGARVLKSDPRVEAYGEVDELNAWLGLARAQPGLGEDLIDVLGHLQRDLFALGARLADPSERIAAQIAKVSVTETDVRRLEEWIDRYETELPPLRRFILPGGIFAAATLHLARAVCRRAERRIVALGGDSVEPVLLAYVNRLSDLLFVLARLANQRAAQPEIEW